MTAQSTTSGETRPRSLARRALAWLLPMLAIAFVVFVVPVRDRCADPRAPSSTRVSVSREPGACILHLKSGEVSIPAAECAKLTCEPGLASTLAHAKVAPLASLLVLYLVATGLWAARWRVLLKLAEVEASVWRIWRVLVESQAVGIVLPGAIGGDALRVAKLARGGAGIGIAIASVMVDRAIGLVMVALVAIVAAYGFGGGLPGITGYFLASIPVAFVVGVALLRAPRVRGLSILREGRIARALAPVLSIITREGAVRAMLVATAISVVGTAVQFLIIRGLLYALGATPIDERWIFVGIAMAMIVSAIPALPGGWGTGDAAFVFFFGLAGVPPGEAFGVSLIYRAFWYVLGIIGGVVNVMPRADRPAPAADVSTRSG